MHSLRKVTGSVAVIALFAFSATQAQAATEQEITDALKALLASAEGNTSVELGTPTVEGDALVYHDVSFTSDTPEGPAEGKIGALTVVGGEVNGGGGLTADSILAETITTTGGDGEVVTVDAIEAVNIDATPSSGDTEATGKFDTISAEGITVTPKDQGPVTIDSIQVEATEYVGDYPRALSFAAEGITIDVDATGEDEAAQQIKALGYETLVVGLYAAGKWDEGQGTLALEDLTIEAEDVGAVTLSGEFGGFTQQVIDTLQASDSPPMELMQQLTLKTASLTFFDDSVTNKVLDQQAQQMGADRATFVEQISAAMPLMLSMIGNPGFQDKLAVAAGAFLKDPQNISITLSPASPVDLMTLMMTGQTEPQTLPDVLNAEVKANEPEAE